MFIIITILFTFMKNNCVSELLGDYVRPRGRSQQIGGDNGIWNRGWNRGYETELEQMIE